MRGEKTSNGWMMWRWFWDELDFEGNLEVGGRWAKVGFKRRLGPELAGGAQRSINK